MITPQLQHLLHYPLTPSMALYVQQLPARFPYLFTTDELCLLSCAVQNSNKVIMNGKAHSH